jgi:threonine/homoserine/homoserine lactone efflux protein
MDAVLFAVSLGLFAGLSPGPLMTLVLASTLERGFRAGVATAVAPFLTDLPVIALSLLVLRQVPAWFLDAVTVVGGLFVAYLGVQTVLRARRPPPAFEAQAASGADLRRGALINLLSPHPWLFWFTIGTPYMLERWAAAPWQAVAFLAVFLALLVGCKVGVAWGVARGRHLLGTVWYRATITLCGVLLVGFGLALVARVV